MVSAKDEPPKESGTPAKDSQEIVEPPPPPAKTGSAETSATVAEEAKEQMTVIMLNSFGSLKNVKVGKRVVPTTPPLEKFVNVQVIMSGVNFQDVMTRLGVMDSPSTPFVMGSECVGKVSSVGNAVTSLKEGDLVFGLPEHGAWAEQVTIPEHLVWKVERDDIPIEKLACTFPYLVAEMLLGDSLETDSTVVVHSAGGSVGLAVKDLAKTCKVIGIASKTKIEKLDGFSALIERGSDYVSEIRKLYPSGVDVVLDPQGGDSTRGISLLAPGGKYTLYGFANIVSGETKSFFTMAKSWWHMEKVSPIKLFEENKTIVGFHLRNLLKGGEKKENIGKKLKKIWNLMAENQINPVIDSTVNFKEVTEGMSKLHERKNIGKILLSFEETAKTPTATATTEDSEVKSSPTN